MTRQLQPINRTTQTDAAWQDSLYQFFRAAHAARRPVLINYLFDPETSHIVPQRLYRYDVFPDYLSRHRDDFEFGFDLITSAEIITGPRTYGLYVIEINDNPNHLYVGQSWYLPEERLAQHLTGFAAFHAARIFKRSGTTGKLRPDIFGHLPRYKTQAQAEAMEAQAARELKHAGFRVEGGH